MLSLKQGLSLDSIRLQGKWAPTDEASVEAWYQNKIGISLNGSDVSRWTDSSGNGITMQQATDTEQPAYNNTTGALTFESADSQHLQSTGQISLSGDFTIGLVFSPAIASPGTILGDNAGGSPGYEFIKYTSTTNFRIRIDNSAANIVLDSGTFGDDYIVITRASNVLTLYKNGVAQSSTPTLSGTADIDAIGIRQTNQDTLDGVIKEIQIFSSSSATLTANVNDRLSTL
jgi:hypothetical protein